MVCGSLSPVTKRGQRGGYRGRAGAAPAGRRYRGWGRHPPPGTRMRRAGGTRSGTADTARPARGAAGRRQVMEALGETPATFPRGGSGGCARRERRRTPSFFTHRYVCIYMCELLYLCVCARRCVFRRTCPIPAPPALRSPRCPPPGQVGPGGAGPCPAVPGGARVPAPHSPRTRRSR